MGSLTSLLAGLVTGEASAIAKQVRGAAIAYGVALVAALFGFCFLLAAAYLWAAERFGAIEASLGFGGGFLAVAGLTVISYRLIVKSRSRRRAEKRRTNLAALGIAAGIAALPGLLRSREGTGALLGPLAALFAYALYRENFPGDAEKNGDQEPSSDADRRG